MNIIRFSKHRRRPPQSSTLSIHPNWVLLFLSLFFWISLLFLIIFIDPNSVKDIGFNNIYLPFFLILFLAIFTTSKLIFRHLFRSLLYSVLLVIFAFLRLKGVGNYLNFILILGIILAYEGYFGYLVSKSKPKPRSLTGSIDTEPPSNI